MKGIQRCTVQIIDVGIHTHQEYIHVYTYKQRKYDGEGKQRTKPTFSTAVSTSECFTNLMTLPFDIE